MNFNHDIPNHVHSPAMDNEYDDCYASDEELGLVLLSSYNVEKEEKKH